MWRGGSAAACVLAGTTSLLCSALFVHPAGPGLLARLQVLRMFQLIYIVGVLLLGCGIGAFFVKKGAVWRCDRDRSAGGAGSRDVLRTDGCVWTL